MGLDTEDEGGGLRLLRSCFGVCFPGGDFTDTRLGVLDPSNHQTSEKRTDEGFDQRLELVFEKRSEERPEERPEKRSKALLKARFEELYKSCFCIGIGRGGVEARLEGSGRVAPLLSFFLQDSGRWVNNLDNRETRLGWLALALHAAKRPRLKSSQEVLSSKCLRVLKGSS